MVTIGVTEASWSIGKTGVVSFAIGAETDIAVAANGSLKL